MKSPEYPPVLFEDNHLLVVDKPANMPVQEDESGDPDLLNLLKTYIAEKYNKPGNVFLGLVHRLDRPATGVMVFARTSKAASRLADQFRRRTVDKTYKIAVIGEAPENGLLEDYLWKDRKTNQVSVVDKSHKKGKRAVLTFQRENYSPSQNISIVSVQLETGRSHQIRVQFAHAGLPLWGDYKYNPNPQPDGRSLALRSCKLALDHPVKKERIVFEVGVPGEHPWRD